MTPAARQMVFENRRSTAIVSGLAASDSGRDTVEGMSLGAAILFIAEDAGTDATSARVTYGDRGSLSYTDCLSVYRDFGSSLRADLKG